MSRDMCHDIHVFDSRDAVTVMRMWGGSVCVEARLLFCAGCAGADGGGVGRTLCGRQLSSSASSTAAAGAFLFLSLSPSFPLSLSRLLALSLFSLARSLGSLSLSLSLSLSRLTLALCRFLSVVYLKR
eukprot:3880293-Rhodomonas_salina.1